jgi:hypothetical protein
MLALMAIKSNLLDNLKEGLFMIKCFSKIIVLGFMVNGLSSFSSGDHVDDSIKEVEDILLKPLEDYNSQKEVTNDLRLFQNAEDLCVRSGRVWELPVSGMNLRRLHLRMLNEENSIRGIIERTCIFLRKKREEFVDDKYVEEINRIYRYHGASDPEEKAF